MNRPRRRGDVRHRQQHTPGVARLTSLIGWDNTILKGPQSVVPTAPTNESWSPVKHEADVDGSGRGPTGIVWRSIAEWYDCIRRDEPQHPGWWCRWLQV